MKADFKRFSLTWFWSKLKKRRKLIGAEDLLAHFSGFFFLRAVPAQLFAHLSPLLNMTSMQLSN